MKVSIWTHDRAGSWWHPMGEPEFAQDMQLQGIEWQPTYALEDVEAAELYIVDSRLLQLWDWRGPTIAHDRIDQANLGVAVRPFLDRILGVIKPGFYVMREDHHGNVWRWRAEGVDKQLEELQDQYLNKVRAVSSDPWSSTWEQPFFLEPPPKTKPYDVGLVMQYGGTGIQFYRKHRSSLMQKLSSMMLEYKCALACWDEGHPLSTESAFEVLRQSKVAVCPFGYTEFCFRDWEVILAGCVPIKPNVRPIALSLYPWKRVVWCKRDWSDLSEAIEFALHIAETGEWDERLSFERNVLAQALQSTAYLAGLMSEAIKAVLHVNGKQSAD